MTLPPLPLPGLCMDVGTGFRKWYSADQMNAHATAAVAAAVLAEREALDSSWEALRVWKEEGERITERHAHNFMFYIGVWWADRPWRDRPTD